MSSSVGSLKINIGEHSGPSEYLTGGSRFSLCFSFLQALRAHTAKRQVLRRTRFNVLAVLAREILPAGDAALHEAHNVIVQDSSDGVNEFFDVVKTDYAEGALFPIIFQPQPQQQNELLFFHSRQPESFLV
jgi:hypothetical protein